ncbi:hypothetical protein FNV64_32220 [Streptomyces sp. S1A1-7]|nr:hypothetical protein FNV64_32220 [Streptomyces sp. S1A1-7]
MPALAPPAALSVNFSGSSFRHTGRVAPTPPLPFLRGLPGQALRPTGTPLRGRGAVTSRGFAAGRDRPPPPRR